MKISAITITFNSGKHIEDTIRSVLSQTYQNFEYLIIDGGSTDGTLDIVRRYEPLFDGRMRWISEKDNGLYDALNKGIRMATGKVVGIIHSDDFFNRNDIFEKVNGAFESHNTQAIYGDVRYVMPSDINKTVRYYSSKNWKPWMFRYGFMPAHPSFYARRECFDTLGFYHQDYYIAGDYELLVRFLFSNSISATYIPIAFLSMRLGGRSTSGLRSNWILNKEIVRACKENGIWTCMPLLYCRYFIKVFEFLLTDRKPLD